MQCGDTSGFRLYKLTNLARDLLRERKERPVQSSGERFLASGRRSSRFHLRDSVAYNRQTLGIERDVGIHVSRSVNLLQP